MAQHADQFTSTVFPTYILQEPWWQWNRLQELTRRSLPSRKRTYQHMVRKNCRAIGSIENQVSH